MTVLFAVATREFGVVSFPKAVALRLHVACFLAIRTEGVGVSAVGGLAGLGGGLWGGSSGVGWRGGRWVGWVGW